MCEPTTTPPPPPPPSREPDRAPAAARFWTARHLAEVTAGRWLVPPDDADQPLAGLSIDTRTLRPGDVFLAIAGPRFDGHDFLAAAVEAGAAMTIVARRGDVSLPRGTHAAVLRVDDAVAALHRLACAWRDVLGGAGCRVIAVAGSNGKTTTRHMVHAALHGSEAAGRPGSGTATLAGTQSPRSFNNHLGVPLTLLAARAEHDFVVAEIGTNHPGEIASLAAIARPDAAVITNVGREHLEHFGSLEAVAREEGALLDHVTEGGLAVVEADAWRQITAVRHPPPHLHVVRFGARDDADADVRYTDLHETPEGLAFGISDLEFQISDLPEASRTNASPKSAIGNPKSEIPFHLPLLGRHNAGNALAAAIVARWMGVSGEQVVDKLAGVDAMPGRLEVRRLGPPGRGLLVLHDAYNANPDSMAAAIKTLAGLRVTPGRAPAAAPADDPQATAEPGRRIAILGDMAELGPHGPDAHRQLGHELAAHRDAIDRVLLVGQLTLFTAETLARHWPNERVHVAGPLDDAAADRIAAMLRPGDLVLLKASRSTALERLLPALEQRFGPAEEK